MSRQHRADIRQAFDVATEECTEDFHEFDSESVQDDEDGIDLDGYEEYLEHLKSKAAVRPCSARVMHPMPTESPQFYMVNADKLAPTRPARPASARSRLSSTPRAILDDPSLNAVLPRSGNGGVRRKRQGEKLVHARIRAVYNDVGRSPSALKQMPASYSATSSIHNKSKVFQEAGMHDEYYRLLDAEAELKATCLQEQQKRVKAIARVRRLEEVIAMKDKKIESLLHAKSVGADRSMSSRSVAHREMAERERQFHALAQKLRQKIAQQSKLLSSYEEAMQSLRSGIKSTNLMELEEERSQLYQELHHHQELWGRQRLKQEVQKQKLAAFAEAEVNLKLHLSRLQQENKLITCEKRKLEQGNDFLKSRVELLQNSLALEQRKRTYDREFGESISKHSSSSPSRSMMLAQALEEMKNLMRRESTKSIKREKIKSPKAASSASQRGMNGSLASSTAASPSATSTLRTSSRSIQPTPRQPRPSSAAITHTVAHHESSQSEMLDLPDDNRGCNDKSVAQTLNFPTQDQVELPELPRDNIEVHSMEVEEVTQIDCHLGARNMQDDRLEKQEAIENIFAVEPLNYAEAGGHNYQPTEEEMEEIQQRVVASAASLLQMNFDDDLDSELSVDMLDDAQHPLLRSDGEHQAPLFDVLVKEKVDISSEDTTNEQNPSELSSLPTVGDGSAGVHTVTSFPPQAFDELYPSDFLDTET